MQSRKLCVALFVMCAVIGCGVPVSAALPALSLAIPGLFGLGILGSTGIFGDFGGMFGKKRRREPSYSSLFGGSFGGIDANAMSPLFMGGLPSPSFGAGMNGVGGMGGGMPGGYAGGFGGAGGGMGSAGGFGMAGQSFNQGAFGRRRRRRR